MKFARNEICLNSQILHENAVSRELTERELEELEVGPSIPIFSPDDVK